MADINLVNVSEHTPILDTDRMAIWPSAVSASTDLKYTSVTSFKTFVNNSASSTFIPKSLVDAKGNLLVGTANDTVNILGVGSNNTVLMADSAQTEGIKWSTIQTGSISDYAVTNIKLRSLQADTDIAGASPALDLSGTTPGLVTHNIGAVTAVTYTASGYYVGATKTVRVISITDVNLTFPSGWKFVGYKPSVMLANKTAILSLTCFGTAETDCVAAWAATV